MGPLLTCYRDSNRYRPFGSSDNGAGDQVVRVVREEAAADLRGLRPLSAAPAPQDFHAGRRRRRRRGGPFSAGESRTLIFIVVSDLVESPRNIGYAVVDQQKL